MRQIDFIALCHANLLDPAIALENADLCEALKEKDDAEIERIIREEF